MENIIPYLEITGIAGLFALFIIQYFQTQKAKKNGNSIKGDNIYSKIAAEGIGNIAENHLNHIELAIREGTNQTHLDHNDQIKVLTEIRTILSERK